MNKNLMYVIPSLAQGGAEHETIDQINHLHQQGQNVFLLVLSNCVPLKEKINIPDNQVVNLNVSGLTTTQIKNFKKIPRALKGINKAIIDNRIDIVIAVLPLSHFVIRVHKALYKRNYSLWCFHKSMQYQATPLNTSFKKIYHKLNKYLSNRYDHGHLFISDAVKDNISDYLKIKNGYVIHNAVPLKVVPKQSAEEYLRKIWGDIPEYLIVIPGRLHQTKGHIFFLETLHKYIKQFDTKEIRIAFVGGGPLSMEIKHLISQKHLDKYIHITGFVENNLLLSFLSLANLVLIPSINEGFGNVAIESLMQGTTILASNAGGLPEIIENGKNGFLFKKLDEEDLMKKFIRIHSENIQLSEDILKCDFSERFTIDAQMLKFIEVISEKSGQ